MGHEDTYRNARMDAERDAVNARKDTADRMHEQHLEKAYSNYPNILNNEKTAHMKKHSMEQSDRGFHASDVHKAAEELRLEGKGSHDPVYHDSKKNR